MKRLEARWNRKTLPGGRALVRQGDSWRFLLVALIRVGEAGKYWYRVEFPLVVATRGERFVLSP